MQLPNVLGKANQLLLMGLHGGNVERRGRTGAIIMYNSPTLWGKLTSHCWKAHTKRMWKVGEEWKPHHVQLPNTLGKAN